MLKKILLCLFVFALAACGGGGSSEEGSALPSNQQSTNNTFDVSTWDNFFWE